MHAVEAALRSQAELPMKFGPSAARPLSAERLAENLHMIHAELDAPSPSRLARTLRRLGVPDSTVPLVTATPALRRSWFLAVLIAVLFALAAAGNEGTGVDRIAVFLTLAPLVPLAGVALAFGRGVDPTHEIVVAAPRDTFRVFLVRSATVLAASTGVLGLVSVLLREGGAYRIAWLLPALAITAATMAGSIRHEPRRVALVLAAIWVAIVLIVTQTVSTEAMFGPITQLIAAAVAVAGGLQLWRSRGALEFGGEGHAA